MKIKTHGGATHQVAFHGPQGVYTLCGRLIAAHAAAHTTHTTTCRYCRQVANTTGGRQ